MFWWVRFPRQSLFRGLVSSVKKFLRALERDRTPKPLLVIWTLLNRLYMEELKYESWAIARQLNALYQSVGQICGVHVTAIDISSSSCNTNRDIIRPTLVGNNIVDDEHRQQLLEELLQQDGLLRQQIRDLIAKLPIRSPDQVLLLYYGDTCSNPVHYFQLSFIFVIISCTKYPVIVPLVYILRLNLVPSYIRERDNRCESYARHFIPTVVLII